ncbi:MAG: DHH family phosphoesterase [Patescibacteria group bacterium]
MTALAQIAALVESADTIALVLHQKPDGDAIGSAAALCYALPEKKLSVVCVDTIPEVFLRSVKLPDTDVSINGTPDLVIVLDCSELHRTGVKEQLKKIGRNKIVVLDHHDGGDLAQVAQHCHVDGRYSATGQIVELLLKEMRRPISGPIADALVLAIYCDTGGFTHRNTSKEILTTVSRLVRYGASVDKIHRLFFQEFSPAKRKLWGKTLAGLEINCFGIVIATIKYEDLGKSGATVQDILGLANVIALTHEARAALVLVEQGDSWRGILRTRHSNVDLGRLAKLFGGKGFKKAAGFTATKQLFSDKINS